MEASEASSALQLGKLAVAWGNDSIANETLLHPLECLPNVPLPERHGLSHAARNEVMR